MSVYLCLRPARLQSSYKIEGDMPSKEIYIYIIAFFLLSLVFETQGNLNETQLYWSTF